MRAAKRRSAARIVGTWRNGETRVKLEENVRGSDVFIIQSMSNPADHHLMELLLMIDAGKRASAARITAVIPYYAYAKQEKKTSGREPISAKLVANLIVTAGVDRVLTLDLHAPAIEGFFDIPVDHLRAAPLLAHRFRRGDAIDIVAVSPDAGGVARADAFRTRVGASTRNHLETASQPGCDRSSGNGRRRRWQNGHHRRRHDLDRRHIRRGGGNPERAGRQRDSSRPPRTAFLPATRSSLLAKSRNLQGVRDQTIPLPPAGPRELIELVTVGPLLAEAIMRIHKDLSISALFT